MIYQISYVTFYVSLWLLTLPAVWPSAAAQRLAARPWLRPPLGRSARFSW